MQSHDDIIKGYWKRKEAEEIEVLANNSNLINEFKQYCKSKGLDLHDLKIHHIRTIGLVAQYPRIALILSPEMETDKEGLTNLEHLLKGIKDNPYRVGVIHRSNFMLLASHFFRRGYDEETNFNPNFIPLFWNRGNKNFNRSILLDMNRVRIDVDGPIYFERETWYGAKFNENISNIPDGNVKLRPPGYLAQDFISNYFESAYSLDIKWTTKDGIKSFQLEEFKTEKIKVIRDKKSVHPVRYVHAEFDMSTDAFRHFDGALHFYSPDEYIARKDSDFNYNAKNEYQIKTDSIKLFKINGQIPVETWVELTSHFLHGNPLILEYFEGKYPEYITNMMTLLK